MKQILYAKIENDYYPMKKLEWEEEKPEDAIAYVAMSDSETGELYWVVQEII